jgi:hypothetical protein
VKAGGPPDDDIGERRSGTAPADGEDAGMRTVEDEPSKADLAGRAGEDVAGPAGEDVAQSVGGGAPDAPRPQDDEEVYYCDLCGSVMLNLHCKLICERCGYKRDCSDP